MAKKTDIPKFGALSGVKVINAALSIAAPFAAQLMAEWGADVVWIESPFAIDVVRTSMTGDQDRRNQRSLMLNIPSPSGREVFYKLIKDADIFIEASKGGQYAKWGLTDEVLWEHNPALVIVHLSGYGQDGDPDYVSRPSWDPIAQAFAGTMNFNGYPDRPPVPAGPFVGDFISGLLALGAMLAALHKAKQSGQGESIDLAQYEALVRCQVRYPAEYLTSGQKVTSAQRPGNRSDKFAGFGVYECKDGKHIYIVFLGGAVFKAGLEFLGLQYGTDEYPKGSIYSPVGSPGGLKLEEKLLAYMAAKTAEEAENELNAAGVPVSVVMDYETAANHPHYKARHVFHEWESIDGKTVTGVNVIPKFKNNPGQVWRGMPSMGMDNEDILSDLGLQIEEIQKLYEDKVIFKK